MKTYELTVYHTVDNCGYPVAYKSFSRLYDLLLYCADFNAEDEDILFDVWEDSVGQFNVNEDVEKIKQVVSMKSNMIAILQSTQNAVKACREMDMDDGFLVQRFIGQKELIEAATGKKVLSDGWVCRFEGEG